jgi:pSer/pThr/pTyr-binding forkhead associated (FHA) protein
MSYRLVIQRRGRRPQVFRLLQPSVVIGRGKGTDLLLPDISVSRHHARVDRNGDEGYILVDLGSQNGTKVNGKKVSSMPLHPGDELQVGKFVLTYEFKAARTVEETDATLANYSTDSERTGFLDQVSATDGAFAHVTTALSREELEQVRRQVRLKDQGMLVSVDTGESWRIGSAGLNFGKGDVEYTGGGLGGSANIVWNGQAHELSRTGGLFFTVTVNGTKVASKKSLSIGDKIMVGKSSFRYEV